ncbi:MAG: photosynthetic complex assembly protein PuhC [Pseudomonadota bacterium]
MTWRPSIGVTLLAMIGAVLVVVLATTINDNNIGTTSDHTDTAIAVRILSFTDQNDGSVNVIDVSNQTILAVVKSGEGAFLRGVLRTLTAERRSGGHNKNKPFELRAEAANRLLLIDKATGREILLNAFGPENAAYFEQFLSFATVTPVS